MKTPAWMLLCYYHHHGYVVRVFRLVWSLAISRYAGSGEMVFHFIVFQHSIDRSGGAFMKKYRLTIAFYFSRYRSAQFRTVVSREYGGSISSWAVSSFLSDAKSWGQHIGFKARPPDPPESERVFALV